MEEVPSIITLRDIEHKFQTKNKEFGELKKVNLDVVKGEILGLIGYSEAGRSVLLKCINLLEHPKTGIIRIDDKNFTILLKPELRQARKEIGVINRKPTLLHTKNVFNNIALSLELQNLDKHLIETEVKKIATFLNLENKLHLFPRELSAGNQQLVAIARALVIKPKILLCDEITSSYDLKTTQRILLTLHNINKEFNTTIVISTNDLDTIKNLCHRICIMHKGAIIEQTTPLELFLNPKTEIAKNFIYAATKAELPMSLRRKLKTKEFNDSNHIIRLAFVKDISAEVHISKIINDFQVKTIVIQAYQELIQNNEINILIIKLVGKQEQILHSLEYLQKNNLHIERIGYVANNY